MKGKKNSKKESSTKQNIILVLLVLVILLCVFFSIKTIVKSKKTDEPIVNDSDAIHKEVLNDTKVGNLTITNARLTVNEGVTTFSAHVNNETDSDQHFNVLYVTFTNGNVTRKIPVLSDVTIKPNEHETISLILDNDVSDTTKIDYDIQ